MLNQSKIRAGLKVATRKVEWLHFIDGATEIGQALNIGHEAAAMLYGLCATANVKSANDKGETFEPDECTLEDLERKQPALVRASDVRHWLSEWSSASQLKLRDTAIANRLPRNVSWKEFCNNIRNDCNGWRAKGKPAWGFSDKQIQRAVKGLMGR